MDRSGNQTEVQVWSTRQQTPASLQQGQEQILNAHCSAHELRNLGRVTSPCCGKGTEIKM